MSGFLARRMALAGAKSLRGAFGKLIKKGAPKAQRAGSRANKGKPLKKSGATTFKGINIKTKAGKEFGEKVKNQPKRIAGQKPEGMRDDLPADIDVPSFLKKKPKKMKDGGGLRDIPEGNKGLPKLPTEVRNKMGFKKDGGPVGPKVGNKVSVKEIDEMMLMLKKGKKMFPEKHKKLKDKILKKKDGGLVSATAKLKAQGLKDGGPVRGKARGMGAATKGGGYNV